MPTSALRIGNVWETDRFAWSLPVTNEGDHAVEVKSFWTTCGCVKVDPPTALISPKQTVQLKLVLDLTAGSDSIPPWERVGARPWAVDIVAKVDDTSNAKAPSWRITGRVRPLLQMDVVQLECGRHSVLDQSGLRGRFTVRANTPLDALTARCTSPRLQARVEPHASDPSWFDIEVMPTAQLGVGMIRSEVVLTLHGAGRANLPEQRVPLRGQVVEDVQAFPESILLAPEATGRVVEQPIVLQSLTGRPVRVKRWAAPEGTEVEALPTEGVLGQLHYRVRQKVSGSGPQSARVRFVLATPNEQDEQETGVDLVWHAVPGPVRLP